MLKKVNQIRRSLSKGKGDKKEKKEESSKKKKSNQKKTTQGSQTDETSNTTKQNAKKLDFRTTTISLTDKEKATEDSKMDEKSNKSSNNYLTVDDIPFIEDESEVEDEFQEKAIEKSLPKTVKILESENGSKIYLIGTCHFSEESVKDVETVIRCVKPDIVVLEICEERIKPMLLDEKVLLKHIMNFTLNDAQQIIKQYGILQGIIQILFLYVSKEITKQTGMLPGSEIRKALVESRKIPHCVYQLGDRPFHITFKRAIGSLTFYQKLKIALSILFSNTSMTKEEVENYKEYDVLETYLNELGSHYPLMKKALVDERDMYLAYSLKMASTLVPRGENAIYSLKLKESRNSLASVEQQLINCKHELDNFKKIKSKSTNQSSDDQQRQIEEYEMKLENLKNQYNKMHRQVTEDTEKLTSFSQQLNSENYSPSIVVGIVGMGHLNGIQRYFNKVTEADIKSILEIPKPSLQSIVVHKLVKYSFYSFIIYVFCRYAVPKTVKESIVDISIKSVNYSKYFISDKTFPKKL